MLILVNIAERICPLQLLKPLDVYVHEYPQGRSSTSSGNHNLRGNLSNQVHLRTARRKLDRVVPFMKTSENKQLWYAVPPITNYGYTY
jgi:hypothetical protein